MKIYIMGSTSYENAIREHAVKLLGQGHEPLMPNFDSIHKTVLETLTANRELMKTADEVHLIYDGRSYGSIFDFGMCFAMRKPLKIIYISPKNIVKGMIEYEMSCEQQKEVER